MKTKIDKHADAHGNRSIVIDNEATVTIGQNGRALFTARARTVNAFERTDDIPRATATIYPYADDFTTIEVSTHGADIDFNIHTNIDDLLTLADQLAAAARRIRQDRAAGHKEQR